MTAISSDQSASPIQPGGDVHFGLTGMAVMGQNLARNVASRGFPLAVHNRTNAKTDAFIAEHGAEGHFVATFEPKELVAALARPRAIMIMVKAGAPVDDVIDGLLPFLEPGDLVVDGGNSDWTDTARRLTALAARDVLYLGTGVSGGEEGALHGPSLMPGGSRVAYDLVEPVFTRIAAQVDGTPCCTYIGDGGAGHYVKMVHNGIEYADMQLIAESYDLLHSGLGLDNDALHDVFTEWNAGDLDSFLIQITANVFARRDDLGDGYLVDKVLDRAGQKGTGRHTAQSALELGAPVTAITEAVFARSLSALKDDRVAASKVLPDPGDTGQSQLAIDDVRDALYASKIVAYAQGFDQLQRASDEFGWSLDLGALATIWRGGCIIRARFLDRIKDVYEAGHAQRNLTLAPYFTEALRRALPGWRRTVAEAIRTGVPTPAYSSALAWYDGYRRARLPANLIQAQRDLFGAHTYERVDRAGIFHSDWQSRR
jgi:6-phosphogluconate dehydrogenase